MLDPPKSALSVMALPIGPPASPTPSTPGRSGSEASPLRRRAEVHSRQRTIQSSSDPDITSRLRRASLIYHARRSTPVLSQDEAATSYNPQYIKPLVVNKSCSIPRKPVQDSPEKKESLKTENVSVTAELTRTTVKGTPRPKLLTLVSEEDNLRRNLTWSKLPGRNSSFPEPSKSICSPLLSQGLEDLELPLIRPRSVSEYRKHRNGSNLSLFNLEPLTIAKTSPAQTNNHIVSIKESNEKQEVAAPLDPSKNPRPYSLYNPDLFSTQHGIGPNISAAASHDGNHRQTQVKFAITAPTPQKPQKRATRIISPKGSSDKTPEKSIRRETSVLGKNNQAISPSKSFLPISSKYIDALKNTASAGSETRQALRLRRHASLARLRELTPSSGFYSSSSGTPTPPLSLWISDLCNATMPLPTPSSAAKSDSRSGRTDRAEQRDRIQDLDDAYTDDERLERKAKSTPAEELTVMIDDMLNDLTGKFTAITSEIMAKMDDMGRRIDNLEASLNHESEKADEDGGGGDGKSSRS